MARLINTKKYEEEVNTLFQARKNEFSNPDDTKYWKINQNLNYARTVLQRIINWNSKAKHLELLPEAECKHVSKNSVGRYVRYETIPEKMYKRIFQDYHPNAGNAYIVDGKFIAKNLKDAVAYCEHS